MSIIAFVAVALLAAAACAPVRHRAGTASLLTCVAIAVVLIAAFALETGTTTMFAGAALRVSPYLRLLLVVGAGSLLLAAAVEGTAAVTLVSRPPESERRVDLQETLPGVVEGGPATVLATGPRGASASGGRGRGEAPRAAASEPVPGPRGAAPVPRPARPAAWSSRAAARISRFGSQAQLWGQPDDAGAAAPAPSDAAPDDAAHGRGVEPGAGATARVGRAVGRPSAAASDGLSPSRSSEPSDPTGRRRRAEGAGPGVAPSVQGAIAAARGVLGRAGTGADTLVPLDAWSARQARDMAVAGLVALAAIAAGLAAAEGSGLGGSAGAVAADALAMQNGAGAALGVLVLGAAAILVAPLAVLGTTPPSLPGLVTRSDVARFRTATRQVRLVALACGAAVAALAWSGTGRGTPAPDATAAAACLVLATIALVLRLGPVPAHGVAARLGAGTPPGLVPALAVWLPTGFALAILEWSDHVPSLFATPGEVRTSVVVLAAITLGVGAVAAAWQRDLARLYAYAAIADTGFAFLALAAAPSDLAVARTWLLVNATAKTALVAWAIAIRRAFGTAELADLAGWARRAPVLGAGLVAIGVATFGLPGWPVWDARLELARNAAGGLLGTGVLACAWLGLLPYARMALLGVEAPTRVVESGTSERPVRVRPERLDDRAGAGALAAVAADRGETPETRAASASLARPGGPSLVAAGGGRLAATARPLVPEAGATRTLRLARAAWNANRTPAAAAFVLAVSLVALVVASPAGSLRSAAGSGIAPLPSPPAVPAPSGNAGASASPGPAATPRPTARPSAGPTATPKPTPARTARPTRRPLASPTAKPKATAKPAASGTPKPTVSGTPTPTPSSSAQA